MPNLKRESVIKYILLCLFFSSGVLLGLFVWDRIELPFQNPWNVVGPLATLRYNPASDMIRFVTFLFFTVSFVIAVYVMKIERIHDICFSRNVDEIGDFPSSAPRASGTNALFLGLFLLFAIVIEINVPTFHASGKLDTFHEGESFGCSISYDAGKVPYRDFLFLHGMFQDPLRSQVAFKLFGKSIGAVRTLESIVEICAFVSLSILILLIFNNNYPQSLLLIIFLTFLYVSNLFNLPRMIVIPPRDITTYSFLITLVLLYRCCKQHPSRSTLFVLVGFLSFLPVSSLIYSLDRGIYLITTFLIVSPILYFSFFHKSDRRWIYLTSSLLGVALSIVFLGSLLQWHFMDFLKFTFMAPRYIGLLTGHVFPIRSTFFCLICLIVAFNLFWLTFKFLQELHFCRNKLGDSIPKFLERYLIEFALLILSVFIFRNSLFRSDWGHVAYSSSLIYLLFGYIILKHYVFRVVYRRPVLKKVFFSFVFCAALTISVASLHRIGGEDILMHKFPLSVPDSQFIPKRYKQTISFLKNELGPDENFLTMTSEASWYYFIDRPSPTRFPIILFAAPQFFQEEVVRDLAKNNVEIVLYDNDCWSNRIDGYGNEMRLPIIMNYIKEKYIFLRKIDDNAIWIRKER
jgi:hypothetical protein